ncbi:MAG TPA: DUF5076 domain-containing protein [Dongiaceae bacterium]|nr:DUF5076 domain-containing protein [Dongiaceae bacterium]
MPPSHNLPVPPEAQSDDAHELIRVWDIKGHQHVSISNNLGGRPREFGQLMAQIALHASVVYEKNAGKSSADCLREILMGFKEEVSKNVGH